MKRKPRAKTSNPKPKLPERFGFHTQIRWTCPFCKLEASAGETKDADCTPAVMHAEPACERFLSLEPDKYMKACRLAFAGVS